MPRKARLNSKARIYYIILRGNNKQDIFNKPKEKEKRYYKSFKKSKGYSQGN